jgi:GrpB-like predicted nucleotidyltransferase (UPF0157 family)
MNPAEQLGLRRGTVHVVTYQSAWATAFDREKLRLMNLGILRNISIEHIGGTSIEGMSAKPIIDIGIGVAEERQVQETVVSLLAGGYLDRGRFGRHGGVRLLQFSSRPGYITHHIHLMRIYDENWSRSLAFRDVLRSNTMIAFDFMRLKEQLSKRYPTNRYAYLQGKEHFIDNLYKTLGGRCGG